MLDWLLALLFLLLGMLNPVNQFDGVLFLVVVNYVYFAWKADKHTYWWQDWLLQVGLVGYSFIFKLPIWWMPLVWFAAWLVNQLVRRFGKKRFILIPVLILFCVQSLGLSANVRNTLSTDLPFGHYYKDMGLFLKTYYLMGDGMDYYTAYQTAAIHHGEPMLLGDVWGYRLPTLFSLWHLIPVHNGEIIYFEFLGMSVMALWATWVIAEQIFPNNYRRFAIFAPYLNYGYWHFANRDWTLLLVEWWAIALGLLGIAWWLQKRFRLSILAFTLAVGIREFMILPIVFTSVGVWIRKHTRRWLWLIPIVGFGLLMVVQTMGVIRVGHFQLNPSLFRSRTHPLSLDLFWSSLAFGSWEYWLNQWRLFSGLLILSIIGFMTLPNNIKWLLGGYILLPFLFIKIGTGDWNHYWGVLYMPIVFILAVGSGQWAQQLVQSRHDRTKHIGS